MDDGWTDDWMLKDRRGEGVGWGGEGGAEWALNTKELMTNSDLQFGCKFYQRCLGIYKAHFSFFLSKISVETSLNVADSWNGGAHL